MEDRQPLFCLDDLVLGLDAGAQVGPFAALKSVLIGARNLADIKREYQAPSAHTAFDVISPRGAQHRAHMYDGQPAGAAGLMEAVDGGNDFAGARRRARTIRVVTQMPFMHINGNHSSPRRIEEGFECRVLGQRTALAIHKYIAHAASPLAKIV